jgi:uncharacterized membrane protein YhaH (DUF805 family)
MGMAVWAVVLFLSPIFFLFVLLGIHRMSSDEIGLVKLLLVVIGPFASTFCFISGFTRQLHATGRSALASALAIAIQRPRLGF